MNKPKIYLNMSTAEIYRTSLYGTSINMTHLFRHFNVSSFKFHVPRRRTSIASDQVSCLLLVQPDIDKETLPTQSDIATRLTFFV